MLIRTFHKPSRIKQSIGIGILGIVALFLLWKGGIFVYTKFTTSTVDTGGIVIWETVSLEGNIYGENGFPVYTHVLKDTKGNNYFLKGYTINLNKYTGTIGIGGTVKEIYKETPVIEVNAVKIPDQSLIIKGNSYFLVKDLLMLDFSNQPQLSVKRNNTEIQVFFNDKPLFTIEHFLCSKVLKDKWCNYLIQDYDKNQKENFDSYRGYTFYRQSPEIRTTFDNNTFGYIFKNVDDAILLNISSMIRIVNKNFILSNKEKIIEQTCAKTDGTTLQDIISSTIEYENDPNHISLVVSGPTNKKHDMDCRVTFDMWNDRSMISVKATLK
jgi:hypothetical protein